MFSFNGDFAQRPKQRVGYHRHVDSRDQLLRKAADDRKKREEARLRAESATKIQSLVRRFLLRARMRDLMTKEIEVFKEQQDVSKAPALPHLLNLVRGANLYMLRKTENVKPSVSLLCQNVLRASETLIAESSENPSVLFSLARFIGRAMALVSSTQSPVAPSQVTPVLRLAEIWTEDARINPRGRDLVFKCLIEEHFFRSCIQILISRSPESTPASLGHPPPPPTPIQQSLLQLIMRPIHNAFSSDEISTVLTISTVRAFCTEVLEPRPEPIQLSFLLPAIINSQGFPIINFLRVLAIDLTNRISCGSFWLGFSLIFLIVGFSDRLAELRDPCVIRIVDFALDCWTRNRGASKETNLDQRGISANDDSDDEENIEEAMDTSSAENIDELTKFANKSMEDLLESKGFIHCIMVCFNVSDGICVESAANICLSLSEESIEQSQGCSRALFLQLAFKNSFIRALWERVRNWPPRETLSLLSSSSQSEVSSCRVWMRLESILCRLILCGLATSYEGELSSDITRNNAGIELTIDELVQLAGRARDVASELVLLAYPGFRSVSSVLSSDSILLGRLFSAVVALIRELNERDARKAFCPEGWWISPRLTALAEKGIRPGSTVQFNRDLSVPDGDPFAAMSSKYTAAFVGLTVDALRFRLIIDKVPCLLPFSQRLSILQLAIRGQRGFNYNFPPTESTVEVRVRRNYIYEDAFTDLQPEQVPDIRGPLKITFQNLAGLDEAGVDGGGLFREFMNQTLKAGFNPNMALFRANQDGALYPNPDAASYHPDWARHFFFLGRLLGKAILEGLLTELHFAEFFLKKLLAPGRDAAARGNVDLHYLRSLDPVLFKNLLSLKQHPENVSELQLDFTAAMEEMDVTRQVELKPGGRSIPVDQENVLEYILLMADFNLNRLIRRQTEQFRLGLSQVIPLELLCMFNLRELQTIISGTEEPIDVEDWRQNTNYGSPYSDKHPTIEAFWRIVSSWSEPSKRRLLKFVTSCSRPPLLGFKELAHKFCINPVMDQDRLPSASTCMNLLKLPDIRDEFKLRQKLLYAIESEAGFELS